MAEVRPFAEPAVVTLPAEIGVCNAAAVAAQLRAGIDPRVSVVVADLTTTAFCDSSGVRILVLARDWATVDRVELRLVAPPGPTLVVLKLTGLDQLLPVYPTVGQALATEPEPDGQARPVTLPTPKRREKEPVPAPNTRSMTASRPHCSQAPAHNT